MDATVQVMEEKMREVGKMKAEIDAADNEDECDEADPECMRAEMEAELNGEINWENEGQKFR